MTGARSYALRVLSEHVHREAAPDEQGDNARLLASSLQFWASLDLDDPAQRAEWAATVKALSDELRPTGDTHRVLEVAILILTAPGSP